MRRENGARTQRSPRPALETWWKFSSSSNRLILHLKHELHKMRFHVQRPALYHQLDAKGPLALFFCFRVVLVTKKKYSNNKKNAFTSMLV